ncbi:MAG: zinc-dependent alcohol dehydrogenase family protein [Roseovarius sp.]
MQTITHDRFGDPSEVLRLTETPSADLKEGEARVSVLRSPINPSDLIQIAGNYGVKPKLPAIPGNEGIGRIVEMRGEGLETGQLVLLPTGGGTWRSEMVARAADLVPLPEADLDQLAMLAINPATAMLLLEEFVDLAEGDWVVQSAANSAVGAYVIQLAKARGVKVACVVRRESAVAGLKATGADAVLVDGPDLPERLAAATDGTPIRLALDAVAGETLGRLCDALAPGGVSVSYGAMSLKPAPLDASTLIFSEITLKGFWLAKWFETATPERRREVYGRLTRMIAEGDLKAPVDTVYPLESFAKAVAHAGAGERSGKVLLAPSGL